MIGSMYIYDRGTMSIRFNSQQRMITQHRMKELPTSYAFVSTFEGLYAVAYHLRLIYMVAEVVTALTSSLCFLRSFHMPSKRGEIW